MIFDCFTFQFRKRKNIKQKSLLTIGFIQKGRSHADYALITNDLNTLIVTTHPDKK